MQHPINVAVELKYFASSEKVKVWRKKMGSLKGHLVPSALYKIMYVIRYLSNF